MPKSEKFCWLVKKMPRYLVKMTKNKIMLRNILIKVCEIKNNHYFAVAI